MRNRRKFQDYESLRPSGGRRKSVDRGETEPVNLRVLKQQSTADSVHEVQSKTDSQHDNTNIEEASAAVIEEHWIYKRGHAVTFTGIFLFTFLVFFRPYELFPALSWLSKSAFVVALITVAIFVPAQLGLENAITSKPTEIKLVLALLVTGLLSIPLALDPSRAFQSFIDYLKVIVMFVVMVNVVRNGRRLTNLVLLVLLASCILSLGALNDYRLGNLALQGRRISGVIGGLFSNPNDLALHLVTMIPISFGLMLGSRSLLKKCLYFGCALLLIAGMVATFSRGGFLALICVIGFLIWKFAPRNRIVFGVVALTVVMAIIAAAPGYKTRISNLSDASAIARTDDLKRSILVAIRHPIFGVGMDNYIIYSNVSKTTHNAYTQVAAEMGLVALFVYIAFLVTPLRRLRQIEQATLTAKGKPSIYYLTIGLQASLVGYMVASFFASVAYLWYAYYLVAYCICVRRIHAECFAPSRSSQADGRESVLGHPLTSLKPSPAAVTGER
ncbi:MAG TPA: O-antigen ligase family protein [Pyrinomonadaceae bacterium]|nr:O-antigen ligase family protein [Pyrinomonadaceae bacterium]